MASMLTEALRGTGRDLLDIDMAGPRARFAAMASMSATLAVVAALALHLDNVWWAGISGFVSCQASRPASIRKGALRIAGTMVGATLGFAGVALATDDHALSLLVISGAAFAGILGSLVSPYGYAWLFAGITPVMVIMPSLADPSVALDMAVYRTLEVVVGTVAALVVVHLLARDEGAPPAPAAPGFGDLLGAQWPEVLHAARTAFAVSLLPLVWAWFDLPGLTQMAVSAAVVMAVPVLGTPAETRRAVLRRAVQRLLGCALGGAVGLLVLAASVTALLPWLLILAAGVYVGAWLEASERGIGYVGIQAAVVFILTLAQGFGPPDSILPGIDRFVGITSGLSILLLASLLIWPVEQRG